MNDYLDYLAHYRTEGSKNGISNTPGYDAIGKRAMTEEERRAKYRKMRPINFGKPKSFLEARAQKERIKFEKWKIKNKQKQEARANRAEQRQLKKEAKASQPIGKKIAKGAAIGGLVIGTAALADLAIRGEKSVVGQLGLKINKAKVNRGFNKEVKKLDKMYKESPIWNGKKYGQAWNELASTWYGEDKVSGTSRDNAIRRLNYVHDQGKSIVESVMKMRKAG